MKAYGLVAHGTVFLPAKVKHDERVTRYSVKSYCYTIFRFRYTS